MKGTAGAKYNLMSLEDALSIRLESIIFASSCVHTYHSSDNNQHKEELSPF